MSSPPDITLLLQKFAEGDRDAANELFAAVYGELKQIAANQMKREQAITLQSTAIVHEAWIKLIGSHEERCWNNRGHFVAAAAQAMNQILVDAARRRKRQKRGGGAQKFELMESDFVSVTDDNILALEEALERLRETESRKAELVVLRFYGGMTVQEAADFLGISVATAERDWAFAKAWLRSRMAE